MQPVSPTKKTTILFVFSFLSGAGYVMTRAVAISLFLARAGTEPLPTLLVIAAVSVAVVSAGARFVTRRTTAKAYAIGSSLCLASVSLLMLLALTPYHHSFVVLGALYVLAEIRGSTNTVNVVSLCSAAFAHEPTMRPYAIVASGAPVAGIVFGTLIGIEASFWTATTILAWALATDLTAVLTLLCLKNAPDTVVEHKTPNKSDAATESRDYRRAIACLFALKVIVLAFIGYQWKVAVGSYFGENETELVTYFAFFYAATDLMVVLIQWSVAGYLLDRFGLLASLCSFPLLLGLIGLVSLGVDTTFALMLVFTLGKGLTVIRRAIHDPALNAAYSALIAAIRRDTILFVKGIIKPLTEAVTACLLFLLASYVSHLSQFSLLWILLIPIWLYFASSVGRLHGALESQTDVASDTT